jgi:hypothetical protein
LVWVVCNNKIRYHPPTWTATTYAWTPNNTSPSWTNCHGQREYPNKTSGTDWGYDILYNVSTHQYTFRCWDNSTFAGYNYATKLSQYPAFEACSNLWNWRRLPTKAELFDLHKSRADCSSLKLQATWYWSSTEHYNVDAWIVNGSNSASSRNKNTSDFVICVHN